MEELQNLQVCATFLYYFVLLQHSFHFILLVSAALKYDDDTLHTTQRSALTIKGAFTSLVSSHLI